MKTRVFNTIVVVFNAMNAYPVKPDTSYQHLHQYLKRKRNE